MNICEHWVWALLFDNSCQGFRRPFLYSQCAVTWQQGKKDEGFWENLCVCVCVCVPVCVQCLRARMCWIETSLNMFNIIKPPLLNSIAYLSIPLQVRYKKEGGKGRSHCISDAKYLAQISLFRKLRPECEVSGEGWVISSN